jgi:hypothetical protein
MKENITICFGDADIGSYPLSKLDKETISKLRYIEVISTRIGITGSVINTHRWARWIMRQSVSGGIEA